MHWLCRQGSELIRCSQLLGPNRWTITLEHSICITRAKPVHTHKRIVMNPTLCCLQSQVCRGQRGEVPQSHQLGVGPG